MFSSQAVVKIVCIIIQTNEKKVHQKIKVVHLIRSLFGITKKTHTTECPVIWRLGRFQKQWEDIGQVCTSGLLVYWTFIHTGNLGSFLLVSGKDMGHW